MSKEDKNQKTEAPTPKRLREARKEGQIAKSAELGAWSSVIVATYLLPLATAIAGGQLRDLVTKAENAAARAEPKEAVELLGAGLGAVVFITLPLGFAFMLLGVAANLAQVGWAPTGKLLKPKLTRLNPLKGLKRLASPQTVWEGGKAAIKVTVLSGFVVRSVQANINDVSENGHMTVASLTALIGSSSVGLARSVAVAGLMLAAADYAFQKRRILKEVRMTRQAVKDEHKQQEGDPHLKGAIRSKQLAVSRNRMMAEVANADVVLVNPTHVAVALRYQPGRGAPKVVAKGAGVVAARIREEADRARVPIVQDIPLARSLFRACELGEEIPADLFDAVARLLAFVFGLKHAGLGSGVHQPPVPLLSA